MTLLGIGALLSACQAPSTSAGPAASAQATKAPEFSGGKVTAGLSSNWDQLDPHKMVSTTGWGIASAMYDRLISHSDGKYIPYLAKSWDVTPDTFTFTLRTDAVCADGTPVTSSVVMNSFKRFFAIGGYYATEFGGPVTVTAPDAEHVVFKLSSPNSNVLYDFARPVTSIVCPAGLADGADFTKSSFGSGPFTLVQALPGDKAIVTPRITPWTWGPKGWTSADPGFPSSIEFVVVTNPTTASNLLLTGGLDVTMAQGPEIARLSAASGLNHKVAKSTVAGIIMFNHAPSEPTSSQVVREAISRAIDPKEFIQSFAVGYADPATSTLAEGVTCYDPETASLLPKFDTAKAKSLLTSAGYVAGADGKLAKDGKPLAITIVGNTAHGSSSDYMYDQLQKLGITTTLQKVDASTWSQLKFANKGHVFFTPLLGEVPSHNINIQQLSGPSAGNRNPQMINDPAVDQAVQAARTSVGAESCRQWAIVQRTLVKEVHAFPLLIAQVHWFSKGVDFEPLASNFIDSLAFRRKG